jgi:hypothetical protein
LTPPHTLESIYRMALEDAAKVADRQERHTPNVLGTVDEKVTHRHCAMDIAAAIRSLPTPALDTGEEHGRLKRRPAWWTHDYEADAFYFAPTGRAAPPYLRQTEVTAILDWGSDGTLAGVELVFGELPSPPPGD